MSVPKSLDTLNRRELFLGASMLSMLSIQAAKAGAHTTPRIELTEAEQAALEKANDTLVANFVKDYATRDAAVLAQYVTDDIVYQITPGMPEVVGIEAFHKHNDNMFKGLDKVDWFNLRQFAIGQIVINDRIDEFYPYPGSKVPRMRFRVARFLLALKSSRLEFVAMVFSTMKFSFLARTVYLIFLGLGFSTGSFAQNPFDETVRVAPYLEPAIPHPDQATEVKSKLAALQDKTGRPPNILLLVVDDLGWGDIGANGGGVVVGAPTPNIDRLASEGLRLTSTYAQSTCTPTRAAFMTGRFPARTGLTRPLMAGETPKIDPWQDEDTAAKLLSGAGYRTALSGKWHLGEAVGSRPNKVGYDEYLGILGVASEMTQAIDERIYPDLVLRPDRLSALRKLAIPEVTKGTKGNDIEVVKTIKTPAEMSTIDQMFADYSDDFIRRSAADKTPFYLVHAFSRVHNDNYPAPGYAGKSPAGFPYKDAIIEVDDIVGRLIQTLRETGQLENTFVFFTSDNGANEDVWPDSGFQPWRGGKGTTWEGGTRVPGIAYWPGMISARPASDGLFDLMDLFNTSLAIAGISDSISGNRYIDGIDQSGFLFAKNGQSSRQTVFMYGGNRAIALRWKEYKVHTSVYLTRQPMRNLDESVLTSTGDWPWVYNLYMDPKEQRSTGHRYFEWGLAATQPMLVDHLATYLKYPRKDVGLDVPR